MVGNKFITFSTIVVLFAFLNHCCFLIQGFDLTCPLPRSPQVVLQKRFGAAALDMTNDDKQRNIFHDYEKPIVLLGSSSTSTDGELKRLASSLAQQLGGEVVVTPTDSSASATLLTKIQERTLKWPDVIVLDWAAGGGGSSSSSDQTELASLAQSLYESGLLSIYINVNPSSIPQPTDMEDKVFVKYSDYELCVKDEGRKDDENWEHLQWELTRLVARARLLPAIPGDQSRSANTAHLLMGQHTFFLSLSFPDVSQVEPYIEQMCQDVDALEYRTDLLSSRDDRFALIYGMQLLRKYSRSHAVRVPALASLGAIVLEDVMPIVYTVRTQHQAGTYPDDDAGIEKMFQLLHLGLRAGVEVLDVESAWDAAKTNALLTVAEERYSSQILGSHHVVGKQITTEEAVGLFEQCALNGRAHGAKVVLSIESEDKDRMAYEAALITAELAAKEGKPVIPNISLILGDIGSFSRVINLPFTPVTHESLPVKAAPGQMTASEIMTTRILTKIFKPKKYAILGHNIAYSVSPQMHGAAFAATKLPHEYIRVDVPTIEEFVDSPFFKSDDFGGTSVTIPHKQAIIPYIDVMSEAAKSIGSVNTVIAREEFIDDEMKRVIYGDNTDWRGIFNPLKRLLGFIDEESSDFALILGAGGTARAAAYVAGRLGLKKIYFNRTPSKAADLVESFGGVVLSNLGREEADDGQSLGDILRANAGGTIRVVISTLPAAANFKLPEWLLDTDDKSKLPVVFDVNYKPFNTALLLQAQTAGCKVVRGSEMLWEQGVGQFELWTGRTAPYSVMKHVVLDNCKETMEPAAPKEQVGTK